MKHFNITIESAADGSSREIEEKGGQVLYYFYSDGKDIYKDEMEEKRQKYFFDKMRNGSVFQTSQINETTYYLFFKEQTKTNSNLIHIALGSGLSSSIIQAQKAANRLMQEDNKLTIKIIDSKIASVGLLMLFDEAIECQKKELSIEKTANILNDLAKRIHAVYATNTLTYFVRGGRLSRFAGFIGTITNMFPIMDNKPDGGLKVILRCRGLKNTIKKMATLVKEQVKNPEEQYLYICHADNNNNLNDLTKIIMSEIPFKGVKKYHMGATIGCHAGPGLFTVFFLGDERK